MGCFVILSCRTHADSDGVAAGNSAGESGTVGESASGNLQLPSPPSLTEAKHIDKDVIKISFGGGWTPEKPLDELRLLRAMDDGSWQNVFGSFGGMPGNAAVWLDPNAPPTTTIGTLP